MNSLFAKENKNLTNLSELPIRSLLLRHKLSQEIKSMRCQNVENSYYLSSNENLDDIETENKLGHLLKYNPSHPIGVSPIIRKKPPKHYDVLRKSNLKENQYSVPLFYVAFKITKNPIFHYFLTFLLLMNVATSVYLISVDEEQHQTMFLVLRNFEFVATVFYCFEMILRIIAKGKSFFYNKALVCDLILLIVSILPPGFVILLSTVRNGDLMKINENIKILYIFNALRVFRLVPRTKHLLRITKALLKPYKTLAYVGFLIILIMYIFAILGMHLFYDYTIAEDNDFEYQYKFSSFSNSMVTVFQLITFDCWYSICKEISSIASRFSTIVYFIVWLWFGAFVFANIFVGIMVDQFKQETEKMEEQKKYESATKATILAHKQSSRGTKKINPNIQLEGKKIAQKISQIYSTFEAFETSDKSVGTDEGFKEEVNHLLKKAGDNFESTWTNEELYLYYKLLCEISDQLSDIEKYEKLSRDAIHSCLSTK